MDAQRQAFLDGVKRAVAGAVLAGGSLLAVPATAAQAAEAGPPPASDVAVMDGDCYVPDFVPYTHSKSCGPLTFFNYNYQYGYSPPGSVVYCYVFDASWFGCGGYTHVGPKTRCEFM